MADVGARLTPSAPVPRGVGLAVEHVSRAFGTQQAVRDVSFTVAPGELVALVGASGSGKTTTLRIVAGYETPDAGRIVFDGVDVTRVPPSRRDFGMVFQHYALFPHMSVRDNVAFGLEARGVPRAERRRRALEALEGVGLGGKGDRGVQQLSGGEQQRVALARAVVIEPDLLLLDEPLSNLDPTLRQSTRDELRAALRRAGAPALFVTHDQEDAFAIADRIVLLAHGDVLQVGTPEELYTNPASRAVATFIGRGALVPVRIGETGIPTAVLDGVERPLAHARVTRELASARTGWAVVRPESIVLDGDGADGAAWPGRIVARRFAGASFVYQVRVADDVALEAASTDRIDEGDVVHLSLRGAIPIVTR